MGLPKHMKICDRDNSSKCGTEFMRWITTYGREGRWLTDITPYMFMLEESDVRTFKYQGANKGTLTVKLLFSNWNIGERSFSGEQVFTGGQFRGITITSHNTSANITLQRSAIITNSKLWQPLQVMGLIKTKQTVQNFVTMSITTTSMEIPHMNGIQSYTTIKGAKKK